MLHSKDFCQRLVIYRHFKHQNHHLEVKKSGHLFTCFDLICPVSLKIILRVFFHVV
jgi:hypothetical protein